ncbi:sensor histidine kinase [Sphingobium aquiterrae]|uniref:sensor histidine kinase n=1 Tax=Sphingobium aquiterrae TaxID=2038656 RepID=UPI0030196135
MRLRSLRGLTLAFLLAFLTTTILTGVGIFMATSTTINHLVDQRIAGESSALAPEGMPADRARLAERIGDLARDRDTGDLAILLTDARGGRIAGNVAIARLLPLGYSGLARSDGIAGLSHGRALVRDIGGDMRLTVAAETEPFDHYNAARLRIYLAGFGAIVALVVGATFLFARTIRRRIVEMRRTVEAIIDGDMRRRVPLDGSGSAFDQQAGAFNRMLDRIGTLMGQISNVSNDIAHELRTPLTRLHQRLALLAARPDAQPLRTELDEAMADANRLLAMFGAMLRIAEVEGGARRAGFAPVALGALCEETVATMEAVAAESGHVLAVERCDAVEIRGDRQLLGQMLINLIENGLRYTPAGSRITLRLMRGDYEARLEVADNGPGIAPAQRERALTRFGRVDPERGSAGYGLGLPLIDAIVRLHRGRMMLEDAAPGLRVAIALPLT